MLLAGELDSIRTGRASPELVRLAGSLERLPRETKADLIQTFIAQVLQRVEAKQHCAPYLAALGLLLNRAPLYAGPETVVAAEFVARAYAAFQDFDWAEPELLEMHSSVPPGGARRGRPKPGCPQVAAQPDRPQAGERRYRAHAHRNDQGVHAGRARRTAPPCMARRCLRAWCSAPNRIPGDEAARQLEALSENGSRSGRSRGTTIFDV